MLIRDALNNSIPFMVRQAHHERNQQVTVHPELVEGFVQSIPRRGRTRTPPPMTRFEFGDVVLGML